MAASYTPAQLASINYQKQHLNDDLRPTEIAINTSFLVVTTIFVLLRFWSRKRAGGSYKADDYLSAVALVRDHSPWISNYVLVHPIS